ncbi:hypothetical protein [Spongiibacter sp.]|uniref:hypothetical protein n=1 Tax=Spongiibacter sp. TaxID=2024860 RepID=UPI0035635195
MNESPTPPSSRHARPAASRLEEQLLLLWDVAIIVLVSANLLLILFDSLFMFAPFQQLLAEQWPRFYALYSERIHADFQRIDLLFVAILLTDVLLGWALAAWQRRYERWWFYPFVHWYDVLGCIPLSGFRWLRILRVVSILFRLQRLGLIDVRRWPAYGLLARYYSIAIEELSDRIVDNVLAGVQSELRSGASQLPDRMVKQVLAPRREALASALAARIGGTASTVYRQRRSEIHDYIAQLVQRTIAHNAAAQRIDRLPGIGDAIVELIEDILVSASRDTIDELLAYHPGEPALGGDLLEKIVRSVIDDIVDERGQQPRDFGPALDDVVALLRQQVRRKRWLEASP